MGRSAARPAAALASLALLGGGCGAEEASEPIIIEEPRPLTRAEARVIERARSAVDRYCARVARAVARGSAPTSRDQERVTAALDRLAALAAESPDAAGPDGASPRLALGDLAENLEGSNCDNRLVQRIRQALGALSS